MHNRLTISVPGDSNRDSADRSVPGPRRGHTRRPMASRPGTQKTAHLLEIGTGGVGNLDMGNAIRQNRQRNHRAAGVVPLPSLRTTLSLPHMDSNVPTCMQVAPVGIQMGLLAKALYDEEILTDYHFEACDSRLGAAIDLAIMEWVNTQAGEHIKTTDLQFYFTDDVLGMFSGLESNGLASRIAPKAKDERLGGFGVIGRNMGELIVGRRVERLNEIRNNLGWAILSTAVVATSAIAKMFCFEDAEDIADHNDDENARNGIPAQEDRGDQDDWPIDTNSATPRRRQNTPDRATGTQELYMHIPMQAFHCLDVSDCMEILSKIRVGPSLPGEIPVAEMIRDACEALAIWDGIPNGYDHLCHVYDSAFLPAGFVRWSEEDVMPDLRDDWIEWHTSQMGWNHWQYLRAWDWGDPASITSAIQMTGKCLRLLSLGYRLLQDLHHDVRLMSRIRVGTF